MRSVSPDARPRLTAAARLTLGYAAVFSGSALLLAALTYVLLLATLRERDLGYARATARRLAALHDAGGTRAVARDAFRLARDDRGEELLIRVYDPGPPGTAAGGALRFEQRPEDWAEADAARVPPPDAGDDVLTVANRDGTETLDAVARPLARGGAVQVGITSDERDDAVEMMPRIFGALSLPLLVLALVGGAWMARRALRPVRHLVETFEAITATGDLSRRAVPPGGRPGRPGQADDVAALVALFNRMLDRIEGLVAGLRQSLDHVAHDLRTPLTRLRGAAEVALAGERDADAYRDALASTLEASEALSALLDASMDVAEAEAGGLALQREAVPLAALVAGALALYDLVAEDRGVHLTADVPPDAVASVDRRRVQQALANLVDNAVKYTPPGGRVHITAGVGAEPAPAQAAGRAWIAVDDTGPGVPPADRERIWERLYRGDESRSERGLGLGLSVVRAVAEAHGGTATVGDAPAGGARFVVTLG